MTITALSGLPAAQSQESPSAPPSTAGSTSSSPVNSTSTSRSIRPTLNLGSQGTDVSELQALLKLLGYYPGTVDGLYQESTASAVSAFQQAVQLQPDGIVGTETWNRLLPTAPPVQQTAASALSHVPPPGTTLAPASSPQLLTPTSPQPATRPSFPTPTGLTPATTPATPISSPAATRPTQSYTPVTPDPRPAPTAPAAPTPTTAASPSTNSPDSTEPVLRRGMKGDAVTQLQTRLEAIGVFSGSVDGVFGAETELAVQEAQRKFSLEPDGVVGPATWEALRR